MAWATRQKDRDRGLWTIGQGNPYLGCTVRCRLLRAWSGMKPGDEVQGTLDQTFVVQGRTLIGQICVPGPTGGSRHKAVPWSRNWLDVMILENPHAS